MGQQDSTLLSVNLRIYALTFYKYNSDVEIT